MRFDGRQFNELRNIEIIPNYQMSPKGSALIRWGNTWVICAASVEESIPPFMRDSGNGWLTAEYNMLPSSTGSRKSRKTGGREKEIQRLVGRSLRAAIDLSKLGERSITVDCDVIQADGGTRVASITGGYVALALAIKALVKEGLLKDDSLLKPVAAVSVGIIEGQALLDLPYEEDSKADVDMNIVIAQDGEFIEVQGTAENDTFKRAQLNAMLDLAEGAASALFKAQQAAIQ